MDNSDKIFEKIRNASENEEDKFPGLEKVWSRVATKLDQKVLKKENNLWKNLAIAVSFLLVFTLLYEIFYTDEKINIPINQAPVIERVNEISDETENRNETVAPETNVINRVNVQVPKKTNRNESVGAANPMAVTDPEMITTAVVENDSSAHDPERRKSNYFRKGSAFEARGVRRDNVDTPVAENKKEAQAVALKSAPLMVVDGKPVTGKNKTPEQSFKEGLSNIDQDDVEDMVVLNEPLYIINGNYYSEQELFGPNPTSPYYPLNQQEIETFSILQGEKATTAYGKKGAKGVVIITTKNGKPAKMPVRKDK